MARTYEKIINTIISEIAGNYEGDDVELIDQLKHGLKNYKSIHNAFSDRKLNYLLSQIIEDCPELYSQQWSSLEQLLKYYLAVMES